MFCYCCDQESESWKQACKTVHLPEGFEVSVGQSSQNQFDSAACWWYSSIPVNLKINQFYLKVIWCFSYGFSIQLLEIGTSEDSVSAEPGTDWENKKRKGRKSWKIPSFWDRRGLQFSLEVQIWAELVRILLQHIRELKWIKKEKGRKKKNWKISKIREKILIRSAKMGGAASDLVRPSSSWICCCRLFSNLFGGYL